MNGAFILLYIYIVYVRLSSADTRSPQLYHISIITTHVVITRKICRYNEKRCCVNEKRSRYYEKICRFNEKISRYYEKICRFNEKRSRYNEKRSRYNDIIEWKKYYMDGSITSPYYIILKFLVLLFLTPSFYCCE